MGKSNAGAGDVFDEQRIRRLVELMNEHKLAEIDLRQGEQAIRLRRDVDPVIAQPPAAAPAPSSEPAAESSAPAADPAAIPPSAEWRTDLTAALAEARRDNRPLLVVSILGDLKRRC